MEEGTRIQLSQEKIVNLARVGTTYVVMAFKLASAIRNGLLISVLNVMNATRIGISKLLGVPPDDYTPTSKGTFAAFLDVAKYFGQKMQGKEDDSKLWQMAKEFDWLPDNYPYSTDPKNFFSESIKFSPNSYAFMFHNFVETYGALAHLSILMRSLKLKNAAGESFSAWEAYEVKDGKLQWTKGSRGKVEVSEGVFKDLEGLDINEIKNMRRAYEKLQGSYRKEEMAAIESTIMGGFLYQFKKYFFQYMKNLFASPFKDQTVGQYVINKDITRPDGVPVWKWESEVMEGRLKVLAGGIMAGGLSKARWSAYLDTDAYNGPNTRIARRKHLMELVNTMLWMALLLFFFMTMFPDDDDKKTYAARYFRRTMEDASMGLNPKDLFQTMSKPVVALDRIPTIGDATFDLFTEGVWGKTTRDGWPVGLKTLSRNTPGAASALQIKDILSDYDWEDSESLYGVMK